MLFKKSANACRHVPKLQHLFVLACLALMSCSNFPLDRKFEVDVNPADKRSQVNVKFNTNEAKAIRLYPMIKVGVERGFQRWIAEDSNRSLQQVRMDIVISEHTRLSKTLLGVNLFREGVQLFSDNYNINTSDLHEAVFISKIAKLTQNILSSIK